MKYSSHYVTHSNSLSSEANGWSVNAPTVSGGVRGRLKIGSLLSDSHSSPSDPQYQCLNQISVIELSMLTVPDLSGRRENISLANILRHPYSKASHLLLYAVLF